LGDTDYELDDREISTAFHVGHGPVEIPYASHILPMTRTIPAVRWAVAALASCHIANRLDDAQLKRQSLQLRVRASQLLRWQLMSRDDGSEVGCLAAMLLLAQLDVSILRAPLSGAFLTAAGVVLWG
jgi:hypothetical protein